MDIITDVMGATALQTRPVMPATLPWAAATVLSTPSTRHAAADRRTTWRADGRIGGEVCLDSAPTSIRIQGAVATERNLGGYDVTDHTFFSTRVGPPPCSHPV